MVLAPWINMKEKLRLDHNQRLSNNIALPQAQMLKKEVQQK